MEGIARLADRCAEWIADFLGWLRIVFLIFRRMFSADFHDDPAYFVEQVGITFGGDKPSPPYFFSKILSPYSPTFNRTRFWRLFS